MGGTQGIRGVDMTEDYRGELRDVRDAQNNPNYPFSRGDYVAKMYDCSCFFHGLKKNVRQITVLPPSPFCPQAARRY